MSPTQRKIIDAILRHIADRGVPPSVAEIAGDVGMYSTSSAHYQLCKMRKDGIITFEDGKVRTIRILGESA